MLWQGVESHHTHTHIYTHTHCDTHTRQTHVLTHALIHTLATNLCTHIHCDTHTHDELAHTDLPSPTMASIAELQNIYIKMFRATLPTDLGYTYEELKTMDSVAVTLVPEKQGTVFKHVEYLIQSKVRE